MMRVLVAGLAALSAFLVLGAAQDNTEMRARQAFDDPKPYHPPAAKNSGKKKATGTKARSDPPVPPADPPAPAADPHFQQAPLVLRYSIQKQDDDGQDKPVDPDTTFHFGDRIKINVEANDSAFLYIAQSGSSGAWKMLFPTEEAGSDNHIEKKRSYSVPPEGHFVFDKKSGKDRVFIVLSRKPETEVDKLVREPIDNRTIAAIQFKLVPRDLNFEKDWDRVTNATYVMDDKERGDTPVVIDLTLNHL